MTIESDKGKITTSRSHAEPSLQLADLQSLQEAVVNSAEYRNAMTWGETRPGHPEGALGSHVAILHENLACLYTDPRTEALRRTLSVSQLLTVNILIDAHDTMKPDARFGVPIGHPKNHASLAAQWLQQLGASNEVCLMTQLHDEGHALFRQSERSEVDKSRLERLIYSVPNWDTFLTFQICDKVTEGRNLDSIYWLVDKLDEFGTAYTVPARAMIKVLAERHGFVGKSEDIQPPEIDSAGELQRIDLNQLPTMWAIQNIRSLEDFGRWLQGLRQDVLVNSSRYYNTEGVTEGFLALTSVPDRDYQSICSYLQIDPESSRDWQELAIKMLEKVRN